MYFYKLVGTKLDLSKKKKKKSVQKEENFYWHVNILTAARHAALKWPNNQLMQL